jgi:hypothetical protein
MDLIFGPNNTVRIEMHKTQDAEPKPMLALSDESDTKCTEANGKNTSRKSHHF